MDNALIKSFEPQKKLNSKIWEKFGNSVRMEPVVRTRLLEIANEFIDFLDIEIMVSDIILTGSLANYNWSKYSDFDLHIVADFSQYSEKQKELYEKLFSLKKLIFNQKQNITIFNYEVELYVQNETESHFSSGVYSVLFDEWANKPKKEHVDIDKTLLKEKAKQWMNIIDGVIENIEDEDIETSKKLLDKYKDKLKKFRTCGLEKYGEYSTENLVFKILRRNGYIEKLMTAYSKILDDRLSMEQ
jgi:predicted nucleotidyltransferase